jgi:hypothetical protein
MMSDKSASNGPPGLKASRREARTERLAAALKANLRRRKAAAREHVTGGQATRTTEPIETLRQAGPPPATQRTEPIDEPIDAANPSAATTGPHDSAQITSDNRSS